MSWWRGPGIPARVLLKLDDVVDNGDLIFGSAADARFPSGVYQMNYGHMDHTLNIPCQWELPYSNMEDPLTFKRFCYLVLDFDHFAGGITATWETDAGRNSGSMLLKPPADMVWGNDTDQIRKLWNDATGSRPGGLFWTDLVREPVTAYFPSDAVGKEIKVTLSTQATGSTPMVLNEVVYSWKPIREVFPSAAEA